ncbi:hypothetical protein [Microbulbifer sp. M83]|uniref:hypothetical protein n=1 Tax=Microbulbifer sp. M83 TaxID=3118246 RepID=UPI002FDFA351
MSTNEIIIKNLFREVSAHVGQEDLPTAQRLLDRAVRKYGHNPEVERFLAKLYRNLGLERPQPEPNIDLPDIPSEEDLTFLAEQEAIHCEEEFVIEPPPASPPKRKKLSLKRDRDDTSESADGPKIVYRSRATKNTFESAPATTATPDEEEANTLIESPPIVENQIKPDPEPLIAELSDSTSAPEEVLPVMEHESSEFIASEPEKITPPERLATNPGVTTATSALTVVEDDEDDPELVDSEDWEQVGLFLDDEVGDDETADEVAVSTAVDSSEDFSYEDLLALDEWDDSGDEADIDPDEFDLEERLTLEQRARQVATDFLLANDLDRSWLDFLTEVFTTRGRGAVRNAIQWAIDRDITLRQLELAQDLRSLWKERQDYWTNLNHAWAKAECAEATHRFLSWRLAIRMVAAFDVIPAFEELDVMLEREYEYWFNHSVLRRAFPVFQRYLSSYRFSSTSRLLPACLDYRFDDEDWAEPVAFSLEPSHGYQIAQQMAEIGIDPVNSYPFKSYAFSDIPLDKLLERWQKPEDRKDDKEPSAKKTRTRKQPVVRRTPDFLLEETTP